ncbi:PucR family transcriptional regulator [Actinomadura sp. GC306]|uniref:PucR family transcriptional regulator ligand-binding domain-containing protein n=1 Tax=Actinomadura sp. GC306 TaxID=2530367 RepID=UPI00104FC168|nr:PucR family transcriptional regulator ligand-binding domain-containing protein [Actinomadura sp. GC306]TDC66725.1 PucR family transcriptional regulator [Actinomadura sp. GC306]
MPPTLASVAALPQLGLRSLTGPIPGTAVVWVAVSELEDPTPFLEGGELLLTTGMRLTPAGAAGYVSRLVGRGVAGLGFAVGVIHDTVPGELLAAARDQGLVLLEVPRPTPFIAVGKAVSRMLAAEWYEDVTRAFHAQRKLTRAALTGRDALVARLARLLGGWALLLDPSGGVLHAEPASAARRAGALTPELTRLRKAPGAPGADAPSASVALSLPGEHIAVQRIGLGGRPRGFLAVGTDAPLPHAAHTIVGAAVALLTLQSETPRTGRDLRASLAALLLGRPADAPAVPRGPVRVLACASGPAVLDALESDPAAGRSLAVPLDGHVAVVVPDEASGAVEALLAGTGPIGVSDPAEEDLPAALRQAGDALAAATRSGRDVVRHSDLPGQGVLGLLDPRLAHAFADALLAPLRAEDLVGTVRAYIAANGQGEAAARALGVHRHTLRSRMRRVADVLGRDPDDPAVRAELWIALAVTSNDAASIRHCGDSQSAAP